MLKTRRKQAGSKDSLDITSAVRNMFDLGIFRNVNFNCAPKLKLLVS